LKGTRPGMKQLSEQISDRRRGFETGAVILTAAGKFIFMDALNWKLPFIICAIVGWTWYVAARSRSVSGILEYWGFTINNFSKALKIVIPFALASIVTCIVVGVWLDTIKITWHILPILLLYPIWGIIQQFLCVALVAGNMSDVKSTRFSPLSTVIVTALLFGGLHYPFYWLIAGTFILALFYVMVYFKVRNLFVLGIFHGWLGAIFFYTVVGRDPFEEVFGKLML
jgi:hypothetical protein